MKKLLALATVTVAFSLTAAAENPFAGAYLGGGFSTVSADVTRSGNNAFSGGTSFHGHSIFGGYSYEISENVMIGGEAGLSQNAFINNAQRSDGTWWWRNNEQYRLPYAGVRIGYVWEDTLMPYLSAGIVRPSYTFEGQNGGVAFDQSVILKDDKVSYTALGMDYTIADNVLGRVELRRLTIGWPNDATSSTDQTQTSLLFGASYRF